MIIQKTYRAHHYRQLWRGLAEITQAANLPASGIFDAFGVSADAQFVTELVSRPGQATMR